MENGCNLSDHVFLNPEQLQISGVTTSNQESVKLQLETLWKNRELITYIGRIRFTNCVISNLQISNSAKNVDGFDFSLTLLKIEIASGRQVILSGMQEDTPMTNQDAKGKGSVIGKKKTKTVGQKNTITRKVSAKSYENYVNSYSGKSSAAPLQRKSTGYNGVKL